jgi:lysophospholipase L1-like esterase
MASRRISLLVVSFLAALAAGELLLARPLAYLAPPKPARANGWAELAHRPSAVPGLSYELTPTPEGERGAANHHGMRDDDPLPAGAPGVVRIAVLGDSFTYGLGVALDEAYPQVLERLIRDARGSNGHARPVDVLNFGVCGYSTADEAQVLEYKALSWHPDLVLVGYTLNDPETDPVQPLQHHFAELRWWQHSQILRRIALGWNRWQQWRLAGGDYFRYLHAPSGDKWVSVPRAFARMQRLAADRGLPVWVAIFPMGAASWAEYPYRDLHAQVASAARAAGFGVIDLLAPLSAHEISEVQLGGRDPHPTPLGHRVAAAAILAALRREHAPLLE